METIARILQRLPNNTAAEPGDYERRKADAFNANKGNLTGYDCPECKNRGGIAYVKSSGSMAVRKCVCMQIRAALINVEKSGLKDLMTRYTFDKWASTTEWQHKCCELAKAFLEDYDGFFYFGGQPGAGKTHLCTAIVGELLKRGIAARYCVWDRESKYIKAVANDDEKYAKAITPLLNIEVLYIDDFLKVKSGTMPTDADVKLAFEIINYRYNANLTTLISSEFSTDELLDIDEAMGSRILERAGRYALYISKNREDNYRLRAV